MTLIISLLSGAKKFTKLMGHLWRTAKKLGKIGISAAKILKDPIILMQILLKAIWTFIRDYVLIVFVGVVILITLVNLVIGSARFVYDAVVKMISAGPTTGWDYRDKVKNRVESMTDEEMQKIIEEGSPYNPKNLTKYIEVEEETTPVNVNITRNYKKRIWTQYNTTNTDDDIPYELSLIENSYNYRLQWELMLALDVVNNTALKTDEDSKEFLENAKVDLAPIYTWGYDKYSKDISNWDQTWEIKYRNGKRQYKKMTKEVYTYDSRPLPILDKVETLFKDYTYKIKEDEVTDTGWSEGNRTVHRWTRREGPKNKRKTVHYTLVTYHKYRTKTVEDKINYITQTLTGNRLHSFLKDNGFSDGSTHHDMTIVNEIIKGLGNTAQLQTEIEDYIGLDYIVGGGIGDYITDVENIVIKPSELEAKVPYFSQKDSRWGDVRYGKSTIRQGGCGPTSMAMAIMSMGGYSSSVDLNNDSIIDPYETAKWSERNGYKAEYGTYWSFFAAIGREVGVSVQQKPVTQWRDVVKALEDGKVVISSMKPGHFTSGGHFISLTGVSEDGKIKVNDPNSTKRSVMTWDFARIILPESKQFWIISE